MSEQRYRQVQSRSQMMLLPPCLDDYVSEHNPVCAIDAFVDTLDLRALGFRHTEARCGAGQPAYDPGLLLKLHMYGYQHRVRSLRRARRGARPGADSKPVAKKERPPKRPPEMGGRKGTLERISTPESSACAGAPCCRASRPLRSCCRLHRAVGENGGRPVSAGHPVCRPAHGHALPLGGAGRTGGDQPACRAEPQPPTGGPGAAPGVRLVRHDPAVAAATRNAALQRNPSPAWQAPLSPIRASGGTRPPPLLHQRHGTVGFPADRSRRTATLQR